jgi:prepilin-type N-terminal cleavage/methylation domain-containing protein
MPYYGLKQETEVKGGYMMFESKLQTPEWGGGAHCLRDNRYACCPEDTEQNNTHYYREDAARLRTAVFLRSGESAVGQEGRGWYPIVPQPVRSTRRGFTLVELIVVIVILGILAAIAAPALTGYIAKSQDQQYIAMARDHTVAVHSVIDELYADGIVPSSGTQWQTGTPLFTAASVRRDFLVLFLSSDATGDVWAIEREASELLGEVYETSAANPGYWALSLVGSPGCSWSEADGFNFQYNPIGNSSGAPYIVVTYKVGHIDAPEGTTDTAFSALYNAANTTAAYDADAGYEVYHLVRA